MAPPLYPRRLRPRLDEALGDTPVVLLNGPRQSGKTTLVQQFADDAGRRYLTLDDAVTLLSAQDDPVGLVRGLDRAVIDEVQRAPVATSNSSTRGRVKLPHPCGGTGGTLVG